MAATERPDDQTTARDGDGLPLDPEARRVAIEAQFDDYRARLAALTEDDDDR